MSRLHLFDNIERSDPDAARGEDSFTFLNRVASPYWDRVRSFLEAAFADYPADHSTDLRARFRDPAWSEHIGAWWELYLFTLFRRLGARVEVHPEMADVDTRPDFRLWLANTTVIVEARYVAAGLVSGQPPVGRDDWITRPLDSLSSPDFTVSVRILARGRRQPRRAQVTTGVARWLDELDVREVAMRPPDDFPRFFGRAGEWEFELTALPMKRARHSNRARRLVGIYPGMSGWDNTVTTLRAALKEKAGKYGRPQMAFIVAPLVTSGFLQTEDVDSALFGTEVATVSAAGPAHAGRETRRDGFWRLGPDSRHTRVTGVLVGDAITPWRAAGALPRLWLNPNPAYPLPDTLGLPTAAIAGDGRLIMSSNDKTGADVFRLAPEWPGPEAPFD